MSLWEKDCSVLWLMRLPSDGQWDSHARRCSSGDLGKILNFRSSRKLAVALAL